MSSRAPPASRCATSRRASRQAKSGRFPGTAFITTAEADSRGPAAARGRGQPSAAGRLALRGRPRAQERRPSSGAADCRRSCRRRFTRRSSPSRSGSPPAPTPRRSSTPPTEPARLVFIMSPGIGGGGGGGGLKNPLPPPRVKRIGLKRHAVSVPEVTPPPPPPAPEPVRAASTRATARAADRRAGRDGQGGSGGTSRRHRKAGSDAAQPGTGHERRRRHGQGIGNGEGPGSGIGDGSGGGIGGGPYRPGSGVTAPRLLREVKAEYTDEARRRGITGDVVLEIVVLRDGSVGDVTVLQGLGAWTRSARDRRRCGNGAFRPRRCAARRWTSIVEVAVEFTLR